MTLQSQAQAADATHRTQRAGFRSGSPRTKGYFTDEGSDYEFVDNQPTEHPGRACHCGRVVEPGMTALRWSSAVGAASGSTQVHVDEVLDFVPAWS